MSFALGVCVLGGLVVVWRGVAFGACCWCACGVRAVCVWLLCAACASAGWVCAAWRLVRFAARVVCVLCLLRWVWLVGVWRVLLVVCALCWGACVACVGRLGGCVAWAVVRLFCEVLCSCVRESVCCVFGVPVCVRVDFGCGCVWELGCACRAACCCVVFVAPGVSWGL